MGACLNKSAKSQENAVDPDRKRLSMSKSNQVDQKKNEKERGTVVKSDEATLLDLFPDSARRWSVAGATSEVQQTGFADKKVQEDTSKAAGYQIGFACKKGLKPESPNQDDFCIYCADSTNLFGVFDGHGPYGHDISNFTHETLPAQLVKDPNFNNDPVQALSDAFSKTHKLCTESAGSRSFDCALSGTTATVALQRQDKLYVAHVGDSRAVLARGRNASDMRAEDLTVDHKPDIEEERRRIQSFGGQVRRLEGDIPDRVFLPNKMYPGLAMTRSIGDTVGVQAGVTSTPDVSAHSIAQDWRFLLLCSDGVWEFINSQEAVEIVAKFPAENVQKSAEALASEAWNRWIHEEGNVVDDITVIVAWFGESK